MTGLVMAVPAVVALALWWRLVRVEAELRDLKRGDQA